MKTSDHIYSYLHGWLRNKVIVVCVGVVLFVFFVGGVNPLSLLYTADNEIIYDEEWESFDCVRPDFCFMHFKLSIGNSGSKDQKNVEVKFIGIPNSFRLWSSKTMPLTSETLGSFGAELNKQYINETLVYSISDLKAGTLIEIELMNKTLPRNTAEQLAFIDDYVQVSATGKIIKGNPRKTAFGRMLTAFF